ncbi:hypothetical protein EJ04DRAFT_512045 [Polyplosphaeria fusca]|uniref:Uncharacterized protein n=1 Tax=Polyplosphaeria fusca TaxID=682080 RepID=A0A9P4R1L1_9PLEO|nr:hypothetical protein EJ04DRAFT_512045 [Polyplosphaeria fusca]
MGIVGLSTNLEPYAESYTPGQLHGYTAIIDGPGLAYHAHNLAREADPTCLPSYADVYEDAIRFLEGLEAMGISV